MVSYIDEDDMQHFEWEWYDSVACAHGSPQWQEIQDKRRNRRMHFIRTGYEPMQSGKLRAPACAILERYREIVLASRDEMYASYWLTHPLSIYENKPPASAQLRDDKSASRAVALDFGEDVIGLMTQFEAQQKEQARYASEKQVEMELERLGKLHTDIGGSGFAAAKMEPVLQSDIGNEEERLKYQHNRLLLPRDVSFAGQAKPQPVVDIDKKRDGAIAMAAEIVGIPIELTQSHSKSHKGNTEGIFQSTNETLKSHINFMNLALTRVFTSVYGETIKNGWANDKFVKEPARQFETYGDELKYELDLRAHVDIQVTLYCDPLLTKGDVYDFVSRGFMSPQEAVKQLESITGLSEGTLKVVPLPETTIEGPTPLLKGKSKKKPEVKKKKK